MVVINKDISWLAAWDIELVNDNYDPTHRFKATLQAFVFFLKILKNNDIFFAERIFLEGYAKQIISGGNMVLPDLEIYISADNACDEKFWWEIFKDWAKADFVVPYQFQVYGESLISIGGEMYMIEDGVELSCGAFSGFRLTTYLSDWMPYLLDGRTPNLDYEINSSRLRRVFEFFLQQKDSYTIIGESTPFAKVTNFEVSNHVDLDGNLVGMDKNGDYL